MAHQTVTVQGVASIVFSRVRDLILAGWHVYGQVGFCRDGCDMIDSIAVHLVRETYPPGKSLLPDLDSMEERHE